MELSHHDKMQNVREQLRQEKVKSSTHLSRYTDANAQIEYLNHQLQVATTRNEDLTTRLDAAIIESRIPSKFLRNLSI